jgi:hypothetical protein
MFLAEVSSLAEAIPLVLMAIEGLYFLTLKERGGLSALLGVSRLCRRGSRLQVTNMRSSPYQAIRYVVGPG